MSEYQRIEFLIDKDGKLEERAIDGHGDACLKATEALEASLGEVIKRELLPEFHESDDRTIVSTDIQYEQNFN
ncbi:DUF2997 domain-containing protein [Pseudanabaena sp. PCC 6802]|uniref:DUF2997 domain-containing protein n=1 Tax=Pseudanabaena sp. PCC 6802 TaxID=118173 RepID=UPI00034A0568|nr:DUF2997 domain-containing protein [Pseudanabaena sp. PCC 6802]